VYLSEVNLLPILFCAAWLPLTCLFVRRFLLRHTLRDFGAAALFLGLQNLVAEPTTVMQTGFLIGMYALYRGWYSERRVLKSLANVGWIAMISICGFAVGAAQILPAIDHVHDSARSRPFEFDLVSAWSMPWAKFGELIFPNILGHISVKHVMWYWGGGLYTGMGSPFLFSVYVGLLTVALCIGAGFVRPRGGRLVLIIGIVSAVLALGNHTPLLKFLYDEGIATTIRYPEKFALMGLFAAIVFASQMIDRIFAGDTTVRDGAIGFAAATAVVALIITIVGFTPLYAKTFMRIWGMTKNGGSNLMVHLSRIDWAIATVRGAAVVAILATMRWRRSVIWMVAAGAIIAADLIYVTAELNPRMPRQFFDPPPLASKLPPNRADFRLFHEVDWYGNEDIARKFFSTGNAVYWVVRNGLFPMTPAGSKVRTVIERDYDKTALLPTVDFTECVWDVKRNGRGDWWQPFMAMSNAWYRASYRNFDEEKKRTKGDFKKSEPIQFLPSEHWPRYYFSDLLITIHTRHDMVNVLTNQSVSPRAAFIKAAGFVPANGVVRSVVETANRATIDVEASGRAFLVMSVTPHKYWRITMDGRKVPAIVTNIGYQGVVVPAGRHRIAMVYRNDLVVRGLWTSGVSVALLLGLVIFDRRRVS
jgi:hypothetical protein